ncbi:hypothetical protein KKA14_08710, partial [bacterium]|nr:hypothetical protein [bacterium]
LIREFHKEKEIIMGSFHQETLYEFRKVCPDVTTSTGPMEVVSFLLLGKTHLSETLSPIATALQVPEEAEIPIAGFRPVIQVVNESFMKAAMKKNMAVQVWTVNEKDQMERLISLGVDGIMTDYPDRLIELIK